MNDKIYELKKELTEILKIYDFDRSRIRVIACYSERSIIDKMISTLDNFFKTSHIEEKFSKYLQQIIAKKNFSISDVVKKSNLSKAFFYEIIKAKKIPSKDTIIQIAVALKLNIEETNKLLSLQGYMLNKENRRDIIIIFCIEKQVDFITLDELLVFFEEKPLIQIIKEKARGYGND